MKVFVVSKNTLIYCGIAVLAVIAAIIAAALSGGKADTPNAESDAARITPLPVSAVSASAVEEYELDVLAGLMKELPVYSVSRDVIKAEKMVDYTPKDDFATLLGKRFGTQIRQEVKETLQHRQIW